MPEKHSHCTFCFPGHETLSGTERTLLCNIHIKVVCKCPKLDFKCTYNFLVFLIANQYKWPYIRYYLVILYSQILRWSLVKWNKKNNERISFALFSVLVSQSECWSADKTFTVFRYLQGYSMRKWGNFRYPCMTNV